MPKVKPSKSAIFVRYTTEFDCFSTDGEVLRCNPCGKTVNADKRFQVTQHIQGKAHVNNMRNLKEQKVFVRTDMENLKERRELLFFV